jgi:hypothetical protein
MCRRPSSRQPARPRTPSYDFSIHARIARSQGRACLQRLRPLRARGVGTFPHADCVTAIGFDSHAAVSKLVGLLFSHRIFWCFFFFRSWNLLFDLAGHSAGQLTLEFGVRDNWCCVCSMENGLQIEIHTAPEIDVRDFAGKWLHEDSDMWCAPDTTSYAPHTVHLWWCAGSGIYSLGGDHAHFVGTDPRHRGRPLPEHEADVGTPAQQCPVPDPTYRRPPSPAEFRLWSTVLQRYAWRASGGRTRTTSDWNRTESRGPTRRSLRRTAKT